MPWLPLLFIALPVTDFWLLFVVASHIGWPWTLLLWLGLGVLGAAFARWRGLAMVQRLQAELSAGRPPTRQVMEGALIAFAGVLFLVPGFITDVIAVLCLIPWTRRLILRIARSGLARAQARGRASVMTTFVSGMGGDGSMADVKDVAPEDVNVRPTERPSLQDGEQ